MNRKILVLSGFTFILLVTGFFYHKFTGGIEIKDNPAFSSSLHQQVESNTLSKTLVPTLALLSGQKDISYHFRTEKENPYIAEITVGDFLVEFDNTGLEVKSNSKANGIRLNLTAVGYGENTSQVSVAEVKLKANLIEYQREDLIEWYVNSPLGLEQGFSVMSPPSANADMRKLNILIDVESSEDISSVLTEQGGAIVWTHEDWDQEIRYGGLFAYDMTGRELPSELRLRNGDITIQIDDREAVYPIVVDPFIQVAKLTDPNPEDSDSGFFGNGVSIDGDTAIVGAPFRDVDGTSSQGAAFVFERDNFGMWNFAQMLTASDGAVGDEFGWDVAIEANRALVGARQNGFGGGDAGAAYIYERNAMGVWTEVQILTASDGAVTDFFGVELSLDGDRALIGAPSDDVGGNIAQGSAYVFERNAMGNWVEAMKLTASDGGAIESFGGGTGISGDTAIVGATGNNVSRGAAYVYVRDGLGVWNEEQKLTASDADIGDAFGSEVFIDGDTAVINAFLAGGASYVFERNAMGIWTETQILVASDANTSFGFGGVAIEGDRLIVGATEGIGGPGSAYIFERNGMGVWEEVQILGPGDEGGLFGLSVSLSGDRAIVGTPRDELGTDEFKGSAYIFELPGAITIEKETVPDMFVGNFDFVGNNFPMDNDCESFILSDGGMEECGDIPAGNYIVEETGTNDATVSIECDSGTWSQVDDSVEINLQVGDDITCTFTNTLPLELSPIFPAVESNPNFMTASPATSNGPVGFIWGFQLGTFPISLPCGDIELGINPFIFLGVFNAGANQIVNMTFWINLGGYANPAYAQAVDLTTCVVSEVVPNIILNTNLK